MSQMRNQLRWQCRRGMLELDFILNRFLENQYPTLSSHQQNLFTQLLKQDDIVLFDWLITGIACEDPVLDGIVRLCKSGKI